VQIIAQYIEATIADFLQNPDKTPPESPENHMPPPPNHKKSSNPPEERASEEKGK
jgi:hypothetical protein